MIYALRIIERIGFQRRNGFWKIGSFITTSHAAIEELTGAPPSPGTFCPYPVPKHRPVLATLGELLAIRGLRERFSQLFPDVKLQIVRFDENIPWTFRELSRDDRRLRAKRRRRYARRHSKGQPSSQPSGRRR